MIKVTYELTKDGKGVGGWVEVGKEEKWVIVIIVIINYYF